MTSLTLLIWYHKLVQAKNQSFMTSLSPILWLTLYYDVTNPSTMTSLTWLKYTNVNLSIIPSFIPPSCHYHDAINFFTMQPLTWFNCACTVEALFLVSSKTFLLSSKSFLKSSGEENAPNSTLFDKGSVHSFVKVPPEPSLSLRNVVTRFSSSALPASNISSSVWW